MEDTYNHHLSADSAKAVMDNELSGVPQNMFQRTVQTENEVNMNEVIQQDHILFLCLDTLRYDVALEEQEAGRTPILNQYGPWIKSFAPGNFTYPSHHTMFLGFLPAPVEARTIADRPMLFFPKSIGMGQKFPPHAFAYEGANIMEGLSKEGYRTICIGGVAFFDKRSPIGSVFPSMFQESYWRPAFGCGVKDSARYQVDTALKLLNEAAPDDKLFIYMNLSAIHYPNYFYSEDPKVRHDNKMTHAAALRYVDQELGRLFDGFRQNKKTFVIALSDHGSCYGENGFQFHGLPNEVVDTVPYKHFFL